MLTNEMAKNKALDEISKHHALSKNKIAILEDVTIERSYGWFFSYNTTEFVQTGNIADGLFGVGPVLIKRDNGNAIFLPSTYPLPKIVELYEKSMNKSGENK